MIKVSLLTGEQAMLLLMLINLAVLIRFVFYPFFPVNGQVQPLIVKLSGIRPVRLNLVPLVHILDYEVKREAAINIIGNLCLFIPTGVILPVLYRRLDCFWKVLLAGAGLSFAIETIQLLFPGSVSDIDDLILNTAGAAMGYGIYKLASKRSNVGSKEGSPPQAGKSACLRDQNRTG